jgi:hypothetical protein
MEIAGKNELKKIQKKVLFPLTFKNLFCIKIIATYGNP